MVEGSGHRISGMRLRGGYQGILLNGGTSGVTIDDFGQVNARGYGLYIASGGKSAPNRWCHRQRL